jgi:hypothetical protein
MAAELRGEGWVMGDAFSGVGWHLSYRLTADAHAAMRAAKGAK